MDDDICSLFSFNHQLLKKSNKQLTIYRNNQFEIIKDLQGTINFVLQFFNNIILLELTDDDNDNEEINILKFDGNFNSQVILQTKELDTLPLATGGVIILCNEQETTTFIDMMTSRIVTLPSRKQFSLEHIHEILELWLIAEERNTNRDLRRRVSKSNQAVLRLLHPGPNKQLSNLLPELQSITPIFSFVSILL
ncbi:Hypothetical_protein [Hexamita inflata]|uniref:Hypothetical_protein n=1 Tax=Hexamita inflata TaxID=28002 RepID=A0AA86NPG1_9EUKA|nr:Hypothetical protein HINF_LOCUS11008 [Hexamita inflata]